MVNWLDTTVLVLHSSDMCPNKAKSMDVVACMISINPMSWQHVDKWTCDETSNLECGKLFAQWEYATHTHIWMYIYISRRLWSFVERISFWKIFFLELLIFVICSTKRPPLMCDNKNFSNHSRIYGLLLATRDSSAGTNIVHKLGTKGENSQSLYLHNLLPFEYFDRCSQHGTTRILFYRLQLTP